MCPGGSSRLGSRNLVLTGFMGTGKTAVGQEIARRLGRNLVDMDALIEAREGMTVAEVFDERGEAHFRGLEAALCRELAARQGLVIATGGGALIPEANLEILGASGAVVCLVASLDEILRRLEGAEDRPLLDAPDRRGRVSTLLAERDDAYRRIPLQVDTSGLTTTEVAERVLRVVDSSASRTILVRHPGGEYPIVLGPGLLSRAGDLLQARGMGGQVVLVTVPPVGKRYVGIVKESLEQAGFRVAVCTVPDGEVHKSLDTVRTLYDFFIDAGLDRRGVVLALGGGVVGDMAGFAAATYLRGVRVIQCPTSLLSMVDSSVGGKVAVDHPRGKNLIGAFKQPELVIIDPETLSTLPAREAANGLAEVVKTGLLGDLDLFEQLEKHGPAPVPWIVERSVRVKAAVVEEDPYEHGHRAVLNLGHTFGHALELLSEYALAHGEGVSVGLVAASRLSAQMGLCDPGLAQRVEGVLADLGLPTRYRDHAPQQIWQAMATDKKRQGKRLRFILLRAVGDLLVTDQVRREDVLAVLETLWEG
jgi:shikimate kinase/3-dehydroquinate synthase